MPPRLPADEARQCLRDRDEREQKSPAELARLHELGLSLLYMGPETGDDVTFKRIAKGSNFEEHVGGSTART